MTLRSSLSWSLPLAAATLFLAGCDSGADEGTQPLEAGTTLDNALTGEIDRSKAGTAIPDLPVTSPTGEQLELASLTGTPVLLNLWATWCAPCVVEMPMLDNLASEMGDDLRVLTVSQDLSGAKVVEPFFAERDFTNLEPWLDQQNDVMFRFSNSGQLPLTVLFDAEGKEVLRVAGAYHWDSEEAVQLIREVTGSQVKD